MCVDEVTAFLEPALEALHIGLFQSCDAFQVFGINIVAVTYHDVGKHDVLQRAFPSRSHATVERCHFRFVAFIVMRLEQALCGTRFLFKFVDPIANA